MESNFKFVAIDSDMFDKQFIKYFTKYSKSGNHTIPLDVVETLENDIKFILTNTDNYINLVSTRYYQSSDSLGNDAYYILSNIVEMFNKFFSIDHSLTNKLKALYVRSEGGSMCWNNHMHKQYVNLIAYPLYRSIADILIESYKEATKPKEDYLEDLLLQFNIKKSLIVYFKPTIFKLSPFINLS